jgi:hypothetical protein
MQDLELFLNHSMPSPNSAIRCNFEFDSNARDASDASDSESESHDLQSISTDAGT